MAQVFTAMLVIVLYEQRKSRGPGLTTEWDGLKLSQKMENFTEKEPIYATTVDEK